MGIVKKNSFWLFLFIFISIQSLAQDLSNIKEIKPFSIEGNIGLNSSYYSNFGTILNRQSPFGFGLNANATISLYGISMPFSFNWYSNEKAGFTQPFNQFGISPTYKWLTFHLGYRNVSFSEYTLNGYTFLGVGLEARPGKFRLGAIYGKFNQNSEYDLLMVDSIPKLTRTGWAAKIGYGTNERFVDISFLHIGDNTKNLSDSLITFNSSTPAQNIAIGLTSKFKITSKLFFNFDGSTSIFTNNRMVTPSNQEGLLGIAGHLMTVNNTTEYHNAIKAGLNYRFSTNTISGIEYRRIDPGFSSMGSYFFNNDLEMITLNQTVSFLKNKITARASIGYQHDNLNKIKTKTSNRLIGSVSGNYNINKNWAIDLTYSNFSINQKAIKTLQSNDLKIYQLNHNFALMPRFMKSSEKTSHVVILNLNRMKLSDKNQETSLQSNTDTYIAMLIYNLGIIKYKLNISLGINYTNMINLNYLNNMAGLTSNISKSFLQEKMNLNIYNALMYNKINNDIGAIVNSGLNLAYRFHPKHSLTFNFTWIHNSFTNSNSNPSFNEIKGDFGYVFTF